MAGKVRGITIELSADASGVLDSLSDINKQSKATATQLKDVEKLLKLDPTNTTLLTQKTQALQEQIGNTKTKLDQLKLAQQDMDANGVDKNSAQYQALQREIIATEQELKTLEHTTGSGSATLAKISAVTGELGTKMKSAGDKISSVGTSLLPVTGAIAALGTAAVSSAANFDSGMSQVQATMGITKDAVSQLDGETVNTMDALSDLAKEMGSTTAFSATDCADAINYLALAGYDTQEIYDTLPTVLNLAAAGGMDLATASDMVTDAMAAMGLETSDADTMVDQMAKTASTTNTSVAQLGEAFLTIGGTAQSLKGGTAELATALGILANNGIKGAEGGTHLRNVILALQNPTDNASEALTSLGVAVYDSEGNMRSMNDILGDLNDAMGDMTDEEKANIISKIFNKTDLAAVNALLGATGDEWDGLQSSISNSAGSAQNMAETQLDNLSGMLTLLKSSLESLAISFGEILMPVIEKVVKFIQGLVTKLNNLDEKQKGTIATIAAIVAAVGPLLVIIGKVVSTLGSVMTGVSKITSAMSTLGGSSFGIIGAVIAGTALLAAGLKALETKWLDNYNAQSQYMESINATKQANEELQTAIDNNKSSYESTVASTEAQASAAQVLWDKLQSLLAVEDTTATQQAEIKAIVDELNELIPGLGLKYDELTNSINKSNEEISSQIALMKLQAQQEAAMDFYTESLKNQYAAQQNLTQAQRDLRNAVAETGISWADYGKVMSDGIIDGAEMIDLSLRYGWSVSDLEGKFTELTTATYNVANAHKNLENAQEDATSAEEIMAEVYGEAAEQIAAANAVITESAETTSTDTVEYNEEIQESAETTAEVVTEQMGNVNDAYNSVDGSGAVAEAQTTNEAIVASSDISSETGANTAEAMDAMVTSIDNKMASLSTAFSGIVMKASEKLGAQSQFQTNLTNYGGKIPTLIAKGATENESNLTTAMDNIITSVYNVARNMEGMLQQAGYYAGQGLYNGLNSWSSALYNQAWSIANSINQAARSALQIKSPSRVMKQVGQYVDQGLIVGMEEQADEVANQAGLIAGSIEDSFSGMNADYSLGLNAVNANMADNISAQNEYSTNSLNSTNSLIGLLQQYLPYLAADKNINFDDGTWAGKLAPAINRELGYMAVRSARV